MPGHDNVLEAAAPVTVRLRRNVRRSCLRPGSGSADSSAGGKNDRRGIDRWRDVSSWLNLREGHGRYRKHLFGDATLQALPLEPPRFVINATNVRSGALWRFSRLVVAQGPWALSAQLLAPTEDQIRIAEIEVGRLVTLLRLQPGMKVADVGAGLGAWTLRFSQVVGPSGHVYATDIGGRAAERPPRRCVEGSIKYHGHQGRGRLDQPSRRMLRCDPDPKRLSLLHRTGRHDPQPRRGVETRRAPGRGRRSPSSQLTLATGRASEPGWQRRAASGGRERGGRSAEARHDTSKLVT